MHVMPRGRSFIGLPAGGEGIDATWLTSVIRDLLGRHERVLVLLESELMCYERGPGLHQDVPVLPPAGTPDRVTEDTMAGWREVDVVRHALPVALQPRVQIASWAHFIDPTFAGIWRHLLAASAVEGDFRTDVLRQGQVRRSFRGDWAATAEAARATSLRGVEALAMRLRIGEVAGYHHEYGAGSEGLLAERLYGGAYRADGLTVESLVGQPARRSYRAL
jgi:hypothetical protein